MLNTLEQWDWLILKTLNNAHVSWLDPVMLYATDKLWWIPLYGIIIYHLFKKKGWQYSLISLLGVAILITLCDRISVELFKEVFKRYRPCHNEILSSQLIILPNTCAGKYGFVSSHATNYFGLAYFISAILHTRKKYTILLYIWAFFIAYTRVYLGVHYVSDILAGALLGVFIAYVLYGMLEKYVYPRFSIPTKT